MKEQMGLMHPEVFVDGQEYPLTGTRKTLSSVVSMAQMAVMVIGVGGNFIPAIRDHPIYQQYQDKKIYIFLGAYFGLNFLQGKLSSTGAFEIFLNDRLVFSKIQSGRMPSMQELTAKIRN